MKERRQSARLVDAVTFKIAYKDYDIICDTLNLSSHGLLCRVNRHIPPMTKIGLMLVLPGASGPRNQEIQAKGVVVRTEKEARNPQLHQCAIFFTDMSKTHQNLIQAYIKSRLVEREFT